MKIDYIEEKDLFGRGWTYKVILVHDDGKKEELYRGGNAKNAYEIRMKASKALEKLGE